MLGDIRQAKNVYIVCGYTDMRKGLNSLVPFVQQNFGIDPYSSSLFLFCGKRCDRLKALLWEPDGFVWLQGTAGISGEDEGNRSFPTVVEGTTETTRKIQFSCKGEKTQ